MNQNQTNNQRIVDIIQKRLQSGKLPCAVAFDIANQTETAIQTIGSIVDNAGIRLNKCQLGLFGYAPNNKIIKSLEKIEPDLKRAIDQKQTNNTITCSEIWGIAKNLKQNKRHVSCACETLGLKIKKCQLGAF